MGGGASGCAICWAAAAGEGTACPADTSAGEFVAGSVEATSCETGAVTSSTFPPVSTAMACGPSSR
eukprot:10340601-Lingulodinium_polyedra.AAC.1